MSETITWHMAHRIIFNGALAIRLAIQFHWRERCTILQKCTQSGHCCSKPRGPMLAQRQIHFIYALLEAQ